MGIFCLSPDCRVSGIFFFLVFLSLLNDLSLN